LSSLFAFLLVDDSPYSKLHRISQGTSLHICPPTV
jgi:hypothetical protein